MLEPRGTNSESPLTDLFPIERIRRLRSVVERKIALKCQTAGQASDFEIVSEEHFSTDFLAQEYRKSENEMRSKMTRRGCDVSLNRGGV